MKYKCSICETWFEPWEGGSEFESGRYDQVFIRRRDLGTGTIGSVSYACCPRCADAVWTFTARLAETHGDLYHVTGAELDELVRTLEAQHGCG